MATSHARVHKQACSADRKGSTLLLSPPFSLWLTQRANAAVALVQLCSRRTTPRSGEDHADTLRSGRNFSTDDDDDSGEEEDRGEKVGGAGRGECEQTGCRFSAPSSAVCCFSCAGRMPPLSRHPNPAARRSVSNLSFSGF